MNEPTPQSVTDDVRGTVAGNHDGGYEDVSTSVVMAIAEATGVDPVEMDAPLHDWIDPDALDAVVDSMADGYVAFDAAGHRVCIDADETVTVDPTE